jgi:MFS family permease
MSATTVAREVPTADRLRRKRDFQFLLTGSSVSMLGSRLTAIGYPLLVLALTGSPLIAGWAGFAATAPSIFVYLPAGALVDRWDPRNAMLVSESGRGVAIGIVVLTVALGHPSVALLIVVAVVEETLGVFSALSERRFICSLVEPDNTTSALARTEARTHMVVLLGRSLGGLLFGLHRVLPFLADALSFFVSAGVLLRIPQRKEACKPGPAPDRHLGREIGEGFRWLHSNRFARLALPLTACTTLIGQTLIMVFLAEAHARHLPPVQIGLVLAASGAGGALGSAAALPLFQRFNYSLLQIQMWVWTGTFAFLALSGGKSFLFVAIAMLVTGFAGALGNIALDTYLLRHVAVRMLGRVTSFDRLTTFCALALGPLLGGILAERCRVRESIFALFLAVGLLTALAAFVNHQSAPRQPSRP